MPFLLYPTIFVSGMVYSEGVTQYLLLVFHKFIPPHTIFINVTLLRKLHTEQLLG